LNIVNTIYLVFGTLAKVHLVKLTGGKKLCILRFGLQASVLTLTPQGLLEISALQLVIAHISNGRSQKF